MVRDSPKGTLLDLSPVSYENGNDPLQSPGIQSGSAGVAAGFAHHPAKALCYVKNHKYNL